MRVIICGGRDYRLTHADTTWLRTLQCALPITEVVLGRGRGCDQDAEWWAHQHYLPVTLFPAEWERYGRAAGPIRNQQMVEYAEGCIAFPGGRGTADCLHRAQAAGLPVWERQGAPAESPTREGA